MESREGWRLVADARKVEPKEGERTPSQMIGDVVFGMAGKEE